MAPRRLLIAPALVALVGLLALVAHDDPAPEVPALRRLPSSSPLGSPHPPLSRAADPTANATRHVPAALRRDGTGALPVVGSHWTDETNPMQLVWDLGLPNGRTLPCVDCAYLAPHVRRFLSVVLGEPWADDLTRITGFDAADRRPGAFAGNGWSVVLHVPSGRDAVATPGAAGGRALGGRVTDWLLSCSRTCVSQSLGVAELSWSNRQWSAPTCRVSLVAGRRSVLYPGHDDAVRTDPRPEAVAFHNTEAAFDGVGVALPLYRPSFTAGTGRLAAYRSTGCGSA
ncbi:MAG: hypothetical protein JWN29_1681 [Acidimicrobiales bacterium]|nr:hypothetical protein [Acidimicrobiales bacterium]